MAYRIAFVAHGVLARAADEVLGIRASNKDSAAAAAAVPTLWVLDIGYRDRNRLCIRERAVRGLHGDVKDVIAVGIGRSFVIGVCQEDQRARRGVDGELVP